MIFANKINVSIVEDTDDIRNALQMLIGSSPCFECTYTYSNAEDAIEDLPYKDVDVVLMDIQLPGMDGIECMRQHIPQMPNTKFMISTVYDHDDYIFNALQSGASGYMLKRTSPAHILEAIHDLYAGGSPMSSEIARRVVDSMQKTKKRIEATEMLTDREKEILDFLAQGFLYREIATELCISNETVKKHIHNIYKKLHVQTPTEALNKAYHL